MSDATPRPGQGRGPGAVVPDALLVVACVAALWGHALLGAATGGARGGFVLLRDAVSTPDPPLSDAALGVGEQAARAVPQDAAMWALQHAASAVGLPEALVLPLLVTLALVLLGIAGRGWALLAAPAAGTRVLVRAPAIALAVWNPFVVERLAQGAWSLLLGVAAAALLPLLVLTPGAPGAPRGRARDARRRRWSSLRRCAAVASLVALAAMTPTGLVLAAVAVLAALAVGRVGGARTGVAGAVALGALLVSAAPVVVGTAFGWGGDAAGSPAVDLAADAGAGVDAFAARAEPGLATVGSLLSLGGMWNADAIPGSRDSAWTPLFSLPLLAVFTVGAWLAWAPPRRGESEGAAAGRTESEGAAARRGEPTGAAARGAILGAAVVVVLVALAATGPGRGLLASFIDVVPAAGVLRDGQKWVGLAIPGLAVAATLCAARLHASGGRFGAAGAAALVLVGPVSVPDGPMFLAEEFVPTRYGDGWVAVDDVLRAADDEGAVLVLPAGSFRQTPLWADGRPVLDPAARLLHTPVLASGDLVVAGAEVDGEGSTAREAERELLAGSSAKALEGLGVGWVLDERTSRGDRGAAGTTLAHAEVAYEDAELTLWRLGGDPGSTAAPGSAEAPAAPAGSRAAAGAAHVAWALVLLGGALTALVAGVGVSRGGGRRRQDSEA